MYRSISADQDRAHLGFTANYKVDAMLCYGTLYEQRVLTQLKESIQNLGFEAEINELPHEFLRFAKEIRIGGSCAYGTMVDRDIDLHIIPTDGKLDRRYRNAVIQSLLEMPDIGRLNIIDLVNFSYLDILSL